jgi:hypothetical protein
LPFTGGYNPSPERSGGGDGTTNAPHLQRVFESLAASRGRAYDQSLTTAVGAENMAYARAITYDLFGASIRFANEMNPAHATAAGLLPRWEVILGQPPQPGDTEVVRRARCAAALGRFGRGNTSQPIIDALTATLGPLFAGLTLFGTSNSNSWYPWYGGNTTSGPYAPAKITAVSGNLVTVSNLTGVPTSAAGASLTLANCATAGNDGTFCVHTYVSPTSVICINNGSPATDNGAGGSSGSPTITWVMANPSAPFMSSIAHVDVQVNPKAVTGYVNADGTLNGAFYAAVNRINPVLDLILPADCTFDWYILDSSGVMGFKLDEQNLDVEAFGV